MSTTEMDGGPDWPWGRGWPQTIEDYEILVEAVQDRLVRYAWRRLGSHPDAEDVVQDVLVRAFADRNRRESVSGVGPYLYRMVANACTDAQRRLRRTRMSIDDLHAEAVAQSGGGLSKTARAEYQAHWVEGLLRRLPHTQAEVIRLRVFEDMRLREIAEVVGCSVDTASSRLRYGFRKLRKMVTRERG